jgi:GT2 family glycosyltransferase
MRISVCIATYNVCVYTQQCLQSLIDNSADLIEEVIVVDDGSSDGTREYLRTLGAPFKVICNDATRGYAYNNNLAVREAKSGIVCLLNADTILKPGWAQPMLKVFETGEPVGMVGNVQWNPRTHRYDHMGAYWTDDLVPKHFGKEWRFLPFAGTKQWPAVTAACCMIQKHVCEGAGGFDESYTNGYEDTDLCVRLGQGGYRHFVAYDSTILHYVSSSPGRHDRDRDNAERFLNKWKEILPLYNTPSLTRLDGINYLVRNLDRPWRYNGRKLLDAWKHAFAPDRTTPLPRLYPNG